MMTDPEQSTDPNDALRAAFDAIVSDPVAAVADADKSPMCECKCNGLEPHSDRRCGKRATTLIALHRWGWCDEDPRLVLPKLADPAACDDRGNMTSLMCDRCADHAVAVAKSKILVMLKDSDTYGVHPTCPTCGKHTQRWQDILESHPLVEWPNP